MPFHLVSAWNKRRRSKSYDTDPCMFLFSILFTRWRKSMFLFVSLFFFPSLNHSNVDLSPIQVSGETEFSVKLTFQGSIDQRSSGKSKTKNPSQGNGDMAHQFSHSRKWRRPHVPSVMRICNFFIITHLEVVAIKKMDLPPFKEAEGEREFRVEVDILSRLDHPNLVSLIGYCADGKHRFLVYEFMQNGNLQDHLNGIGKAKMSWPVRLKIALGAAKGLAYLHSSSAVGIPIVHRDFKSTNVLLDSNFNAKISDFGLAKLMPEGKETYVTARVLGTFGYFDPEYTSTGKLTLQSDVYAFGVVLLELLTGRRAVDLNQGPNEQNLVLQVRNILNDRKKLRKVIDPELPRNSYSMEAVAIFADLASRCIRIESSERPSMMDCVKELQLVIICSNSKGGLAGMIPTFKRV